MCCFTQLSDGLLWKGSWFFICVWGFFFHVFPPIGKLSLLWVISMLKKVKDHHVVCPLDNCSWWLLRKIRHFYIRPLPWVSIQLHLTHRSDFSYAICDSHRNVVRDCSFPSTDGLSNTSWIARSQVTEWIHSCQLHTPGDTCKKWTQISLQKLYHAIPPLSNLEAELNHCLYTRLNLWRVR